MQFTVDALQDGIYLKGFFNLRNCQLLSYCKCKIWLILFCYWSEKKVLQSMLQKAPVITNPVDIKKPPTNIKKASTSTDDLGM